jgi:hypothetical protein
MPSYLDRLECNKTKLLCLMDFLLLFLKGNQLSSDVEFHLLELFVSCRRAVKEIDEVTHGR